MKRRVVITGLGTINSLGHNVDDFWDNVKAGKCGIDYISTFDTTDFPVKVVSEVKDFNAKDYLERKDIKRQERFSQFALIASDEAMKMSGLDMSKEDPYRVGTIIGSGVGSISVLESEHSKAENRGYDRVAPLFVPKFICNMAAGNVAIRHGLKGKNIAVVTACATGTQSIGEAFRAIQYGEADVMLAGGTESSNTKLCIAGFNALTALSTSDDKDFASRPFDKNRDGFVMGEGAGVIVLEELEHALNRGANILAEVGGYGATCDAYHMTSPDENGSGAIRSMDLAITEAGIEKGDISYINAHGTSTPYNDKIETKAIRELFGEDAYKIPVNSTKSMIGHLLGGAGAVEAVVCVKSILDGFVHQTLGASEKDPECDLDYVIEGGRHVDIQNVLSNSLGFGGHNGTLVFKKFEQ